MWTLARKNLLKEKARLATISIGGTPGWSSDTLTINGQALKVAGISSGGDVVVFQYGFVTSACGRTLLEAKGVVNAFLLRYKPGASVVDVQAGVESVASQARIKSVAAW